MQCVLGGEAEGGEGAGCARITQRVGQTQGLNPVLSQAGTRLPATGQSWAGLEPQPSVLTRVAENSFRARDLWTGLAGPAPAGSGLGVC